MSTLRTHLPIYREVWGLAFPVILTNLLMSFVNIVDVFMVGRLGPVEIAAVGMGNSVRMLVLVGILSVTAGAMALAAQAKGARNPERLSFVTKQTLSLTLFLGAVLTLLGYVTAEPLLRFLNSGGDPLAVTLGASYLELLFLGTVFLVGNFAISSLMQGAGDTMTPLFLSGGVNLLNIGFNYLFIFGPGPLPELGVTGAALGTVSARLLGVAVGLAVLYSGKNVIKLFPGGYRPNPSMFWDILKIGIPSGLQGVVRNSAQLLVIRIVTSTAAGTFGAAALAIGLQIESLAFMPGLAISVAATSLVGQSLGAWQVEEAKARGNAAILLGVFVMTLLGIPLLIFAPSLVRLFDPSAHPTVVTAGSSYLRVNGLALPILAIAMVVNGALRGAGDTRPGLFGNILGRWLTVVPLAYLLAITFKVGVTGVWWSLAAGTTVSAMYVLARWRSEKWVGVALKQTPLYRYHLKRQSPEVRQAFLQQVRTPLLAKGATEHAEADGVIYRLEGENVHVHFGEQGFEVETRSEPAAIPHLPPARAQPSLAHD